MSKLDDIFGLWKEYSKKEYSNDKLYYDDKIYSKIKDIKGYEWGYGGYKSEESTCEDCKHSERSDIDAQEEAVRQMEKKLKKEREALKKDRDALAEEARKLAEEKKKIEAEQARLEAEKAALEERRKKLEAVEWEKSEVKDLLT